MKKIIALVLAVALLATTGIMLTGCGAKKDDNPTAATTATTATTAATEQSKANGASNNSQNAQSGSSSKAATGSTEAVSDYIDEATALENVKQQIGTGGKIVSYYQGFAPDGTKAWVVTVEPVTTSDGPATVTYYTNYLFCYAATDQAAEAANSDYVDEATALQNVRQQIGSGGQILDYYQGTTPDGIKAWVVTVQPVTTADGAQTVIYYVNHQFCYPASSN